MNKVILFSILSVVMIVLLLIPFIMIKQGGAITNKLKLIIGLILYVTMPIFFAVIVAKAFAYHDGKLLIIILISLIVLEIITVIIKIIRYKKNKQRR